MSERPQSDAEHRRRLESMGKLIDGSPAVLFLWRIEPGHWPVEVVSAGVQGLLDYSPEDFLSGRVSWPGITHPEDVPRLEQEVGDLLAAGRDKWSQQYRLITKDGRTVWVEDWNRVVRDADGKATHIQGLVMDITARKRTEEQLRESEELFRGMFESGPLGMEMSDRDFRFIKVNRTFCRMLGYTESEMLSLKFPAFTHPDDVERDIEASRRVSDGTLPVYRVEKRYIRKDGSIVWGAVTLCAVTDAQGRFLYRLAMIKDISDRKRSEAELQERRRDIYHMGRVQAMAVLASSVAHEVSQPLAAILSNAHAAQLLLDKTTPDMDEVREILADIVADGKRAGDIVDRARAMVRKGAPSQGDFCINQAIRETMTLVGVEFRIHGMTTRLDLAEGLPKVRGDKTQVQQVVLNLLMNAEHAVEGLRNADLGLRNVEDPERSRRAERGGTAIVVSTGLDASGNVTVSVRDTGPGMDARYLAHFGEPFRTTKPDGLGMGLAICRSIVEAHGGRIWAENRPEGGAAVTFTLRQ